MTHSETGEVMVLKELYRVDEQAQTNFLKEVRNISYMIMLKIEIYKYALCWQRQSDIGHKRHDLINSESHMLPFLISGCSFKKSKSQKCPAIHWSLIQGPQTTFTYRIHLRWDSQRDHPCS